MKVLRRPLGDPIVQRELEIIIHKYTSEKILLLQVSSSIILKLNN